MSLIYKDKNYMEWVEMFTDEGDPVYHRATVETVIKHQKEYALKVKKYNYNNDETALLDFIAEHGAYFIHN